MYRYWIWPHALLRDAQRLYRRGDDLACKLGEDTAVGGETLVTEGAYAAASDDLVNLFERREADISGLTFPYFKRRFNGRGT